MPCFFHTLCCVSSAPWGLLEWESTVAEQKTLDVEKTGCRETPAAVVWRSNVNFELWPIGRVIRGTVCKATTHILDRETCTLSLSYTQTHTETNTSPVGFKEHPLTCLSAHFDCQHVMVPKLDDSESRTTVNKLCVCGFREGTERLMSVGGTDYSYRSWAQQGMKINTHILSTLHNSLPLTSCLSYATSSLSLCHDL